LLQTAFIGVLWYLLALRCASPAAWCPWPCCHLQGISHRLPLSRVRAGAAAGRSSPWLLWDRRLGEKSQQASSGGLSTARSKNEKS